MKAVVANPLAKALLLAVFVLSVPLLADSPLVTALPESSATYPAGTVFDGFGSTEADPRAPFGARTVHFLGWGSGGSLEQRGGAYLIYRVRIEFNEEVTLNGVTVTGAGHQDGDAVLRLLDTDLNEIAVQPTTGFNTIGRHTLSAGGAVGSVFVLDEFDHSTTWRYRGAIELDVSGASGPPTLTVMEESSPTYPDGSRFDGLIATSSDPLGPFDVRSVHFKGWVTGGSSEQRGGAYLVYRYKLEFAQEVILSSVTVGGAGHQDGDAVLRLLDANRNEIAVQPAYGFNTYGIHTLQTGGAIGRIFFLDEFDHSHVWRYRDLIVPQFVEFAPPKYSAASGNWYQAIPTPGGIDWLTARAAAEGLQLEVNGMAVQGHLATITCPSELLFLRDNLPEAVAGGYFLGGYQPGDTPELELNPAAGWAWVTGEPFVYSNWDGFEPNDCCGDYAKEDALHFFTSQGAWNDLPMEATTAGYIVEFSLNLDPECPKTAFNPANGHLYESIWVPEKLTWDEAKALAEARGGYLATITSAEENEFLFQSFPEASRLSFWGYWLGGIQPADSPVPDDPPTAGWEWVTGEPFDYTNWADGEPNDCDCQNFKEDALQFWGNNGTWNDIPREFRFQGLLVEYDDRDGDGIPDALDGCPFSDLSPTVVVAGCDSGVANLLFDGGCTLADLIQEAAATARNHGAFVSAVSQMANELKAAGPISNQDKARLQSCAARARLP